MHTIIQGQLCKTVLADETVWTLGTQFCYFFIIWLFSANAEEGKMVRILMVKSDRSPANCWMSLLENEFESDPFVFDKMEKKLTLERFQREVRIPSLDYIIIIIYTFFF